MHYDAAFEFDVSLGAKFMEKVVDVFLDDELLIFYPIAIGDLNGGSVKEADFIEMAKENLRDDQHSVEAIVEARFKVRNP